MKKIFTLLIIAVIVLTNFSVAEESFIQAQEIIKQRVSCLDLSESQLEALGDFYMEQMHPGELHEIMDARMGGEGSESLRQVHINMGRMFYCGQNGVVS